ncbi:MAG: (Fe-S)-binding protein [Candidatus Lokiarchaeota archaeon]
MNDSNKQRKYPTQEVEPENFLTNDEVHELVKKRHQYKFNQEDYYKLYNCVHCRECGTSDERILLKQKFLKDGNEIKNQNEIKETFERYETPYKNNKSRIKLPKGVLEESETLLYFGCFTSVKTPKYGQHVAEYLISHGVEFTTLDKEICCGYPILVKKNKEIFKKKGFKRIITVCPSCYMVFQKHYSDLGIDIEYYTNYLEPSKNRKEGEVSIQHACPLVYDRMPDIKEKTENILRTSGYRIMDIPLFCCGGGVGHQLRKDVSEKIARLRVHDFKGDYVTYYCPDCYWFIKVFGKKEKLDLNLKDLIELIS